MNAKAINIEKFKEAVAAAFKNDKNIVDLYDDNVKVETIDDVVNDVVRKIKAFDKINLCGVYEKNELIGYYAFMPKILVSFSINNQYRVRNKLREFFELIRESLGSNWGALLWSKNLRAVKWLVKMNCKIIDRNSLITVLHFGV